MVMTQADRSKYKTLYLKTAKNYIEELLSNQSLLQTMQQSQEAVSSVHRAAHSLASQSILMGYENIGKLSKLIEHILQEKIENKAQLEADLLGAILESIQKMQVSISEIEKNDRELDLSQEIKKLEAYHKV